MAPDDYAETVIDHLPSAEVDAGLIDIVDGNHVGPFASVNAMRIPDYIALGVLIIILIVWAVRDWAPQRISEALRLCAVGRTSLRSDLIRAAQFAIGEELRTEFQTPHELPSELRTRMEELAVRHG